MVPEDTGTYLSATATAEARLEREAPGYLGHVRDAARRLGVDSSDTTGVGAALDAVEEVARIDLDVPTGSRMPGVGLLKRSVKRLITWYLRYVGQQLTEFGQAVSYLGALILYRTERVEAATIDLRNELARLEARVHRLEQGGPADT